MRLSTMALQLWPFSFDQTDTQTQPALVHTQGTLTWLTHEAICIHLEGPQKNRGLEYSYRQIPGKRIQGTFNLTLNTTSLKRRILWKKGL